MAQPLGRQILFLQAVLLPLLLALIVWTSQASYQDHLDQLQSETRVTAVTVAAYLNRSLDAADGAASALALHPDVQGLSLFALDRLATLSFPNIVLARADGQTIGWARPVSPDIEGTLPTAWLADVARADRNMISPVLGRSDAGQHVVVLAYPVHDQAAGVVGVIGLEVHLESIEHVLASLPLPAGSVVTVADERGIVVARSRDSAAYVGRPVRDSALIQPPSQVPAAVVRESLDGVSRTFANAVVDRGPWIVSVGIPTSVAWQRAFPVYRRNIIIAIGVTLVVLGLEVLLVRRFVRAFTRLEQAAERVAAGDLAPPYRHTMPARELDHVQGAFAKMVTEVREAHAAVQAQVVEERRMREEVQLLQRQVMRQERLAAIGVLVSGVAHELNNPLQAILGFSDLLQMRSDLPEGVRGDLRLIQKESARASAIIRNLSRFGRQGSEPTLVRLSDVVASVIELRQRRLADAGIRVDVDSRSTLPVRAVFTELQQVLLNFVINAEQAILAAESLPRRSEERRRAADGADGADRSRAADATDATGATDAADGADWSRAADATDATDATDAAEATDGDTDDAEYTRSTDVESAWPKPGRRPRERQRHHWTARRADRVISIRTWDADGRVHLEVEDTGPGVPPDDEPRLFQPFFTTKPVGEGTGLGLSVSYGIVQSHGGSIGYRPGAGGGAEFHFDLPAA